MASLCRMIITMSYVLLLYVFLLFHDVSSSTESDSGIYNSSSANGTDVVKLSDSNPKNLTLSLSLPNVFVNISVENQHRHGTHELIMEGQCYDESCHQTPRAKTCQCDDLCLSLGDCCRDYYTNTTVSETNITAAETDIWQCVNSTFLPLWYPQFRHGFRIVSRCPREWPLDDIRQSCENPTESLLLQLYVSGGKYFLNIDCALCNGVNRTNILLVKGSPNCAWLSDTQLECTDNIADGVPFNSSLRDNATYLQEVPMPRFCLIDVKERCQNEFTDISDKEACWRNYAPLIASDGSLMKNPSCSMCNDNLFATCYAETTSKIEFIEYDLGIVNIFKEVLRTFSKFDGPVPYCLEGTELDEYGRCVPLSSRWATCDAMNIWAVQKHGSINCLQETLCYRSVDDFLAIESSPPCFELRAYHDDGFIFDLIHEGYIIPHLASTEEIISRLMYEESDASCPEAEVYLHQKCLISIEDANVTMTCNFDMIVDSPDKFQAVSVNNNSMVFYNGSYIEPLWWHNETFLVMDNANITSQHTFHLCGVKKMVQTCPYIVVMNETVDYIQQENRSVLLYKNKHYDTGEFIINPDGSISICYVKDVVDNSLQMIVGHVVFAISSVCLFLTFITYCSFPTLRNRQGIVIMNFLVALFFGQVLLQYVGYQVSDLYWLCVTVAALSHFFFVSSFVWTTVLAWDLSRSFSASKMTISPSRSFGRKMVLYIVIGWGMPFLLVSITLLLQFAPFPNGPLMEYGGSSCWFTSRIANLAMFFAPICLCLLANLVLFGITIHGVHSTRKSTAVLRKEQDSATKQRVQELTIYIKISALLGFGWLFGFLAMVINVAAMWYLFIIVSGLQGVFIFVSFGMNRRTRKLWRTSTDTSSVMSSLTRKGHAEVRSNTDSISAGKRMGTKV